jgi:hypothetical protein
MGLEKEAIEENPTRDKRAYGWLVGGLGLPLLSNLLFFCLFFFFPRPCCCSVVSSIDMPVVHLPYVPGCLQGGESPDLLY